MTHPVIRRAFARSRISSIVLLTGVAMALPAWSGGLAILESTLTDNGDGDGFADTGETVSLSLTVQNTTGATLTDLELRLVGQDPSVACASTASLVVGDLAAGEVREVGPFVFTVAQSADRVSQALDAYAPLSATFGVRAQTSSAAPPVYPSKLTLDLDLDVAGGSGQTTYFESFEESMGTFENENLDQTLNNLGAADGYRCHYSNPDWFMSGSSASPAFSEGCYPGGNSQMQANTTYWNLSGPGFSPLGGRGFTGFHSLFYGIDLGPPRNWTTPMGNLEAVRTADPIHLDWDGVSPTLSFMHQASFADDRAQPILGADRAYDRGVAMIQLADANGDPAGNWIKLEPYQNVHDKINTPSAFNCTFDVIDDGSTEDDFFDPGDPMRRTGPSTTCYPERVFVFLGDTDEPFNAGKLGSADGPGLQGMWGIGTWVETRFDLSRFRGRSVRLRLLATTIEFGDANVESWEDITSANPEPSDDGWWVDDVTIEGALVTAAAVAIDAQDNSALPGPPGGDVDGDGISDVCDNCLGVAGGPYDLDLDGFGAGCDCNAALADVFPGAVERNDGLDNQCPGDAGFGAIDETSDQSGFFSPGNDGEYSWAPQPGATEYEVARAASADFILGCTLFGPLTEPVLVDNAPVPPGEVRFYLNRALQPNDGSWGRNSAGQERNACG